MQPIKTILTGMTEELANKQLNIYKEQKRDICEQIEKKKMERDTKGNGFTTRKIGSAHNVWKDDAGEKTLVAIAAPSQKRFKNK